MENGEKGQEKIKPEQPWSMLEGRKGGGTLRPTGREGAMRCSVLGEQVSFTKKPD